MKQEENLINSINDLIVELKKTDNTTLHFFSKINESLKHNDDKDASIKRAVSAIISSSKIVDFGGYNREQEEAWHKVYNKARTILENNS